MKLQVLTIVLSLGVCPVWAQVGELYDANVVEKTTITDPAVAVESSAGQWVAFELPVMNGTRSPCCWKGKWNRSGAVGCSLELSHQSYGTSSESPIAENIVVFARVEDSKLRGMRIVGEACPVDAAGATVNWIGGVDPIAGLNWLETMATSTAKHSVGDSALHALALHENKEASQRLYGLAKNGDEDIAEEAVFWLGEARGDQGFSILKKLLAELPEGDVRREINFALSLSSSPGAVESLIEISRSDKDPEQRGEALFWLADEFPGRAKDILLERLKYEEDEEVLEEAIFAISELPGNTGGQMLIAVAKDKTRPREMRRQALFWLANSDDDDSVNELVEMLTK